MAKRAQQPVSPASGSTLVQKTVAGFFWMMAQTVGSKMVNMVGQVMLAWLLSPEDFGLVGLAYTVTAFATLIHQAGIREILIHRHAHFSRWATPAFWISLTAGCLAGAAMLVAAPIAAHVYEEPSLVGLVLVLALAAPFNGLDVVPDAFLVGELRFRYVALVKWIYAVGTMGLSVLFAHLQFGAYSFVLPQPIMLIVRLVMLWTVARPPIKRRLYLRRWKYLLNDSALLFLASFFIMLTWQGDYIVLGIWHDAKTVGIYFFAFNLSIQTMQVFTSNLSGVLFPALSKLQGDIVHQTRAFLRATELLALVGVPFCLLQAALAGPAIAMLFNSWWEPAIRVLQLLSIGMAVRLVASPGGSLMQAQGRFRTYLLVNAINSVVFLVLVGLAAYGVQGIAAAHWVAAAVMIYFAFVGPVFMYIAIRPGGGRWGHIWHSYAAPVAASTLALSVAVFLGKHIPIEEYRLKNAVRIGVIVLTSTALYLPLIRYLAPERTEALWQRLASLYRRRTTPPLPQRAPQGA